MPRYIVTRTLPPLTSQQLDQIGRTVVSVCAQMPGMEWVRSHLTADGKHSFCEFEAPDAEACREHSQRAGLPIDEIIAVQPEIGPAMFK